MSSQLFDYLGVPDTSPLHINLFIGKYGHMKGWCWRLYSCAYLGETSKSLHIDDNTNSNVNGSPLTCRNGSKKKINILILNDYVKYLFGAIKIILIFCKNFVLVTVRVFSLPNVVLVS